MNGNAKATHDTARKHLTSVARDLLTHEAAGTVPVADEIIELPAARYTDPDEVAQLFDFLGRVVATEDLPTSHAQQKALSTGILNSIRFGRNEGGLQQFHRWTNTLLDTPDGELDGLFRSEM